MFYFYLFILFLILSLILQGRVLHYKLHVKRCSEADVDVDVDEVNYSNLVLKKSTWAEKVNNMNHMFKLISSERSGECTGQSITDRIPTDCFFSKEFSHCLELCFRSLSCCRKKLAPIKHHPRCMAWCCKMEWEPSLFNILFII